MQRKKKHKIRYSILIVGFTLLVYVTIGLGHSMFYKNDVYVCRHMSRDIEDNLETVGIPVTIVRASNDDNSKAHMWIKILGVEFDSVTLMPYLFGYSNDRVEYNDYEEYEKWRKEKAWEVRIEGENKK